MANDLTPQEKAKAGLWLMRQAILELLGKRGGMQPSEISAELGTPGIAYSVFQLMLDAGEIEKGDGRHPVYSVKQTSTQI
jgi:hypothetical protein